MGVTLDRIIEICFVKPGILLGGLTPVLKIPHQGEDLVEPGMGFGKRIQHVRHGTVLV